MTTTQAKAEPEQRSVEEVLALLQNPDLEVTVAELEALAKSMLPEPGPEMPTTVIAALARVMLELPGIGRDAESEQGYNYRGIEGITRHAQHLLGKYQVVFTPRVLSREVKDFTINNRPWTEDQAMVEYTVYGPSHGTVRERRVLVTGPDGEQRTHEVDEVVDDSIVVGPLVALGRDNSDKGMNKCMTQAFKYALIQTLCIGDGKDDADKDVAAVADERPPVLTPEQLAEMAARSARSDASVAIRLLPLPGRDAVRAFCDEKGYGRVAAKWTDEQLAEVEEFVDHLPAEQQPEPEPVAPPADLPFDPADLPAGRSLEDDLRWLVKAPEGLVQSVAEEVKLVPDGDVPARLDALDLPKGGKIDQRRQRVAARMVRLEMERMAGIAPPEPKPEPEKLPEPTGQGAPSEATTAQDEPVAEPADEQPPDAPEAAQGE